MLDYELIYSLMAAGKQTNPDEVEHMNAVRSAAYRASLTGEPVNSIAAWMLGDEWSLPPRDSRRPTKVAGEIVPGPVLGRDEVAALALAEIEDFGILHAIDPDDGIPVTIGHLAHNACDDDRGEWGIVRWAPGNTTDRRFQTAHALMRYCMRWVGRTAIVRALARRGIEIGSAS